jgi:hypothetical protein
MRLLLSLEFFEDSFYYTGDKGGFGLRHRKAEYFCWLTVFKWSACVFSKSSPHIRKAKNKY